MSYRRFRVGNGAALRVAAGILAILCAAGALSCNRTQTENIRRVAILPFEYQGSDDSSAWLAEALTAAALEQARGVEKTIVTGARDQNSAVLTGSAEIVRGVVSGAYAQASLTLYVEDVRRNTVRIVYRASAVSGAGVLEGLRDGLDALGLAGARFSTTSASAFGHFGQSLVAGSGQDAERHLLDALKADPTFTSASLRLAAQLARGGSREAAVAELERLVGALPADRQLERAYAHLELASIRGDAAGILEALEGVVKSAPDDLDARGRLAAIYFQQRRYAEAADAYGWLTGVDPGNATFWNQAVYSSAYAGNREQAGAQLVRYREAAVSDPNVDDTEGDIHYFFGDFARAAASYEAASQRNPAFLNGFSQFKAAWAWLMAAEFGKADEAANRYVGELRKTNPPLADFRSAQWQYLRGRREEARSAAEAMRTQSGKYPQAVISLLASQLYFWDAAEKGADAFGFTSAGAAPYGTAVRPVVAAMAQATEANLNPAERARRVTPLAGAAQQPLFVAAAVYLGARRTGKVTAEDVAALRMADAALQESRAMVTHAMLGWALLETGQARQAADVFRRRLPPVAEDDGLLWALIVPDSFGWELESWKALGQQPAAPQFQEILSELGRKPL